ncbi:MAG: hypothetical protein ACRDQ4_02805 [Pseudonocardiaceae bacterium]
MAAHRRTMPLLCLLVRLGWQRDPDLWTVRCRDGNGRRARIHVHLAPIGISLAVPSPGPVQLTLWEAGQLRAALRDAIQRFAELAGPDTFRASFSRPEPPPPPPGSPPTPRGRVQLLPALPPPIRPTVAQIAQRLATSLTPKPKNDHDHADDDEVHRGQAVA